MKKVLVTGALGQLGYDISNVLQSKGCKVYSFAKQDLDITNYSEAVHAIESVRPDIIIHCAAYTKVDMAEKERDLAFLVNAIGTRNIAVISENIKSKLVYISTDYVFDGTKQNPYNEFDITNPINIYGKSKLAGEQFVKDLHSRFFIVRTSWLFGKNGNNFAKTMLRLADNNQPINVVHDQFGCPTYTLDLANCISEMIETEYYGIYHASNTGSCSWYEFAAKIFEMNNKKVDIVPIKSDEFPTLATRPKFTVFDQMALRLNGFSKVRHWENALYDFLV